jgi:hypothetical protein
VATGGFMLGSFEFGVTDVDSAELAPVFGLVVRLDVSLFC